MKNIKTKVRSGEAGFGGGKSGGGGAGSSW